MTFEQEFGHWPEGDRLHDALRVLWRAMEDGEHGHRERYALAVVLPYVARMDTILRDFVRCSEELYEEKR
jgi:hypothetical protein